VVQIARLQDGSRKIVSIAEVVGVKDDLIDVQDVFLFDRTGVSDAGKVQGRFRSSGVTPNVMERLHVSGIEVPQSIFDETLTVP
jgi:pilus assembly protein CpaF